MASKAKQPLGLVFAKQVAAADVAGGSIVDKESF